MNLRRRVRAAASALVGLMFAAAAALAYLTVATNGEVWR